ncbi:MIP18 family protein [Trypanosoma rangeli]|uniref:MIP18 family protein n=1 Tax=Trypanosoma rangeli TaxID=5698 RepID=A0A422NPZ2_TRYRA|nr:MIP18 family protein [Trypanosoma rangeli]RNF07542.1 MIP18 family protein [Trypanosoma rangeli]|eukprot:RNF07542.1 MIP18 family protein [Trypanosoma rangeli]
MTELVNPNPTIFRGALHHSLQRSADELLQEQDDALRDPIDALEVFQHICTIRDPEHPNTLEELKVVEPELIHVDEANRTVRVQFTPTVPHCSMTTLIGLCISLKLQRSLPRWTKVDVCVTPCSHEQEEQVNKQLKDKERVAAALENKNLLNVVESCLNEFE